MSAKPLDTVPCQRLPFAPDDPHCEVVAARLAPDIVELLHRHFGEHYTVTADDLPAPRFRVHVRGGHFAATVETEVHFDFLMVQGASTRVRCLDICIGSERGDMKSAEQVGNVLEMLGIGAGVIVVGGVLASASAVLMYVLLGMVQRQLVVVALVVGGAIGGALVRPAVARYMESVDARNQATRYHDAEDRWRDFQAGLAEVTERYRSQYELSTARPY